MEVRQNGDLEGAINLCTAAVVAAANAKDKEVGITLQVPNADMGTENGTTNQQQLTQQVKN